MTNVLETSARLRLRKIGVAFDLVVTAVILAWWLMAVTGHADGNTRVLALCWLICVALTVIALWRLRTAQHRARVAQDEPQVQP
ncbi:hypothetical protein [Nocardia brasiliensis]|uniref:hypothetical protein n=1 Tax=Nocardia brasiliensis TaxID=37326 RepID=UPI0018934BFF|nr:hypothetical protein [Nocardia brasiliensis]MBF6131143.1 hypothetical protein [Nocardia brasiliensis]